MKSQKIFSFVFLFMLLLSSCGKNDPSLNATRLRINLTDAAAIRISEFNLEISSIEALQADSIAGQATWKALEYSSGVYNILTLTNGKYKQLVDQYFPIGHLKKLKIVFGNNSSLKINGNLHNLIIPEEFLDGVVVDVNADLYPNYISSVMVDINAALSIREINGNYFFYPNLRAFPETFGGSVKGNALPLEANPYVIIVHDTDTLISIPEVSTGAFLFKGLKEGIWKIGIIPDPATGYKDSLITDTVYSGKELNLKSITLKK